MTSSSLRIVCLIVFNMLLTCDKAPKKDFIIDKKDFILNFKLEGDLLKNTKIKIKFKNEKQTKTISFSSISKMCHFYYQQENKNLLIDEVRVIIETESNISMDYLKIKNNLNLISISLPDFNKFFIFNKNTTINEREHTIENKINNKIVLISKRNLIKELVGL